MKSLMNRLLSDENENKAISQNAGYEPFNHIGLFEGIGGFSLASEWAGWETKAWCEWSTFCQRILKYHFPKAIPHHDITKTDFTIYRGLIDIVTGGFPCQGFSLAGSRLGTDDDRYLWPEMRRAYQEIQPAIIIGENVTGILSMEDKSGIYRDVFPKVESKTITRLCEVDKYEAVYTRQAKMLVDSICNDLEKDGYEVQPIAIPASSVQAPHQRERIWFIAYRNGYDAGRSRYGETGSTARNSQGEKEKWERIWAEFERTGFKGNVTNTESRRKRGLRVESETSRTSESNKSFGSICGISHDVTDTTSIRLRGESYRSGKSGFFNQNGSPNDWGNFPTELPILFGDDGLSAKLDGITFSEFRRQSLKSAGNAIVPQVYFEFCKAINAQRFS